MILLTTRKKEVALQASSADHIHQPQSLDEKQSWELLEKIAIPESEDKDSDIYVKKRELGKKMVLHCSGLPLAISVIASLLRRRDKVVEWEAVHKNVDKYIMSGRNFLGLEKIDQEYYGVSGVLALSYEDLPSRLKLCFLYLAQFPEDYEIPVKRLTQLWIAEGFIASTAEMHASSSSVEIVEDVAYGCLIHLVERSMVQVEQYDSSGTVKICRLHDLMRDWCLQKAKEENFLDVVVNFSAGQATGNAPIAKVRRLAFFVNNNMKHEYDTGDRKYERIRSLLYFVRERVYCGKWNTKAMQSVFHDLSFLRVLKFKNIRRGWEFKLPKTFGKKLVHLRFFSLKNSDCCELPSSLSNLVLLQTLDLRCREYNGGKVRIRNVFGNMEQLRHLYLPSRYTLNGQKLLSFSKLQNLQTLANAELETCDLNSFVHLTNLKKLDIFGSQSGDLEKLKNVLMSTSTITTFEHLRSLSLTAGPWGVYEIPRNIVLKFPRLFTMRLLGKITGLPEELPEYRNLTKIKMTFTELKGDQIEILKKLPKLRELHLLFGSMKSETLVFSQGGFSHLEMLTLGGLAVKEWRVEKEALPCLQRLHIQYFDQLLEIPERLQNVSTLKELTPHGMRSRFCMRVAEGGEDFYKIKHVPSLIITMVEAEEETELVEAVENPTGDSRQGSFVDGRTEEIHLSSAPDLHC